MHCMSYADTIKKDDQGKMKREQYVYTTKRVRGRVVRTYVGKRDSPEAIAYEQQQRERAERRREQLRFLEDWSQSVDLSSLEAVAMRERGYTKTEQRHWRRCELYL
jgi:hypothetical protein